jgi:hypothetical protein
MANYKIQLIQPLPATNSRQHTHFDPITLGTLRLADAGIGALWTLDGGKTWNIRTPGGDLALVKSPTGHPVSVVGNPPYITVPDDILAINNWTGKILNGELVDLNIR